MIRAGATQFAMRQDRDEGQFVERLLWDPSPEAAFWSAYTAVLEPLDPRRAEFLRLEVLLSGGDREESTPDRRARYDALLADLADHHGWLSLIRRGHRIRNCGAAPRQDGVVRFAYQCPKQWVTLTPTDRSGVRYCGGCRSNVYFCGDVETAEQHARAGDCIAVPAALARAACLPPDSGTVVTGRPDYDKWWAQRIFT